MTASYSASLLEAWNPNLSAYSISILLVRLELGLLRFPVHLRLHLQRVSKSGGRPLLEWFRPALSEQIP